MCKLRYIGYSDRCLNLVPPHIPSATTYFPITGNASYKVFVKCRLPFIGSVVVRPPDQSSERVSLWYKLYMDNQYIIYVAQFTDSVPIQGAILVTITSRTCSMFRPGHDGLLDVSLR